MTSELKTNAGTRIGSMLLDHIAMTFIAMFFSLPGTFFRISNIMETSGEPTMPNFFDVYSYIGLIGMALYFCKDSFNGRSLAKIALKLQVVENETGKVASPLRCFARNLFCVLWPIEFFVILFSPSRRIGDFVAGTKVVPFDPERKQAPTNFSQIAIAFLIGYGLLVLMMMSIESMLQF